MACACGDTPAEVVRSETYVASDFGAVNLRQFSECPPTALIRRLKIFDPTAQLFFDPPSHWP